MSAACKRIINSVLGDMLTVILTGDRVGQDNFVDEFAHSPLEEPVTLVRIRTGEARHEP